MKSRKVMLAVVTTVAIACVCGLAVAARQTSADPDPRIRYVDVEQGSDAGDGSDQAPWRSLAKARAEAKSGDTVYVRGRGVTSFRETVPPRPYSDYVTFRADARQAPHLDSLTVDYVEQARSFLRFEGFQIAAVGRPVVVLLGRVSHVQLVDVEVSSEWPAYGSEGVVGIRIQHSIDVAVERARVHTTFRSIQVQGSAAVSISGSYLTPVDGSAIQWLGGNSGGVIEGNHIHGQRLDGYPGGHGAVRDPHASMISIRSDGLAISGNLMHGMGSSSGVMLYEPDAAGGSSAYSDIAIDNNAIYDVANPYAIRIYNLGNNIWIRNNLLFSHYRRDDDACIDGVTADARYRYSTALQVHTMASGYDGAGLHMFNNVMMGRVAVPDTVNEGHNVVWSWHGGGRLSGGWRDRNESPSGSSMIVTGTYQGCEKHSTVFEDGGFFAWPLNPASQFSDPRMFHLAEDSIGNDFGDPTRQVGSGIGRLTESGFLDDWGKERNRIRRAVGPFEPPITTPSTPRGLRIVAGDVK